MSNYITTTSTTGKGVFSSAVPEARFSRLLGPGPDGAKWELLYSTNVTKPVIDGTEVDLKQYAHDRTEGLPPGGITHPAGSSVVLVIMPPGGSSPMHRTTTLDVDYVLQGSVRLDLDSGETRILHAGDSVVMRGTNHQWTNITEGGDGVFKMICFAQSLEGNVTVGEHSLGPFGLGPE